MNLTGILTAIEELKSQTAKDYGSPVSQEELLEVLGLLLKESRLKEIKRKFVAFGPEYILGAIEYIKNGNKESREPVGRGESGQGPRIDCGQNQECGKLADRSVESPPPGGPKLVKAASRASKSI